MPTPTGCDFFPYPTEAQAQAALCNLSGNDSDPACQKHCMWVLQGYMDSQEMPVPAPGPDSPDVAQQKLKEALMPVKNRADGTMKAVDWKSIITTILTLLLSILAKPAPVAAAAATKHHKAEPVKESKK